MINRLSNLINRNCSATKISQVLCSNTYAYSANSAFSENQRWLLSTRGMRSATIVNTSPCHIASKSSKQAYILTD